MWSGFFAAVLGGIAAIGSVLLGWFFNQYLKKASIKKALQLEIDTNWQKLALPAWSSPVTPQVPWQWRVCLPHLTAGL